MKDQVMIPQILAKAAGYSAVALGLISIFATLMVCLLLVMREREKYRIHKARKRKSKERQDAVDYDIDTVESP